MSTESLERLRIAFNEFRDVYQKCRMGITHSLRTELTSKLNSLENRWWRYIEENNLSNESSDQESELGYMYSLCHAQWSYCQDEFPDKVKLDEIDHAVLRHRLRFEAAIK